MCGYFGTDMMKGKSSPVQVNCSWPGKLQEVAYFLESLLLYLTNSLHHK